jgi:hypothetical protein
MNNGIYLGVLGVVIVLLLATIMDRIDNNDIDLNNLPPPAAGIASQGVETVKTCEGVIFGISSDGIKFAREAGGGNTYAALIDGKVVYYELGEYDHMTKLKNSDLYARSADHLKYSLLNCDANHLPSGVSISSFDS